MRILRVLFSNTTTSTSTEQRIEDIIKHVFTVDGTFYKETYKEVVEVKDISSTVKTHVEVSISDEDYFGFIKNGFISDYSVMNIEEKNNNEFNRIFTR